MARLGICQRVQTSRSTEDEIGHARFNCLCVCASGLIVISTQVALAGSPLFPGDAGGGNAFLPGVLIYIDGCSAPHNYIIWTCVQVSLPSASSLALPRHFHFLLVCASSAWRAILRFLGSSSVSGRTDEQTSRKCSTGIGRRYFRIVRVSISRHTYYIISR